MSGARHASTDLLQQLQRRQCLPGVTAGVAPERRGHVIPRHVTTPVLQQLRKQTSHVKQNLSSRPKWDGLGRAAGMKRRGWGIFPPAHRHKEKLNQGAYQRQDRAARGVGAVHKAILLADKGAFCRRGRAAIHAQRVWGFRV